MLPYVIALSDPENRLEVRTLYAGSISHAIEKVTNAKTILHEIVAIREIAHDEIDGYVSAAHVPQVTNEAGLLVNFERGPVRCFLLIVDPPHAEPFPIAQFGTSISNVVFVFDQYKLREFPAGSKLSAVREMTTDEIENIVVNIDHPSW